MSQYPDNLMDQYLLSDCLLGPGGNGGVKQRLHSAQSRTKTDSAGKIGLRIATTSSKWHQHGTRTPSSHWGTGGDRPGVGKWCHLSSKTEL